MAVGAADGLLGRLGRPREEAVVGPGDARAYEIVAGEWVQIVDVRGCQVSDFLAFRHDRRELGISNAVTRALVDGLFPLPGQLFSDADGEPLLELVEDTVGRHDTFGLACNREYYEALGIADHRNCTDNFNRELAAFGFEPRRFWEPVNFFFNTRIAADGRTVEVEPALSKPGDYVLLRAVADLVVASSACPDDVLATNGFNPTEIMVRVFPPSSP